MEHPLFWHAYFSSRAELAREVLWESPERDTPHQRKRMARSLSHFQLGESGDGKHIRTLAQAFAQKRHTPEYAEAVAFFVKEENAHARLLLQAVKYLAGSLVQQHWTETIFIFLRQVFSLRMEVQVLACAEIIGLVYYQFLHAYSRDTAIRRMCEIFLQEERAHVQFDADSLFWMFSGKPSVRFTFFSRVLFFGVFLAAWVDHGASLRSFGVTFFMWTRSCWREYFSFAFRRNGRDVVF